MSFSQFNRTLTVQTPGPGSYVGGVWTAGPSTERTIQGSWQPASSADMAMMPEGLRTKRVFKLFTNEQLVIGGEEESTTGERIIFIGRPYWIYDGNDWQNRVISHYEYTLVACNEPS